MAFQRSQYDRDAAKRKKQKPTKPKKRKTPLADDDGDDRAAAGASGGVSEGRAVSGDGTSGGVKKRKTDA